MIEIQALAPASWPLWRDLRLAALAEVPAAFTSGLADWQDADVERWRARLAIPGAGFFAMLLDGEPAGMASGLPGTDGIPQLGTMWVSPGLCTGATDSPPPAEWQAHLMAAGWHW